MIVISGSGNSYNVVRAEEYAKEIGTPVIGIIGYHGERLKEMADYHMDVMVVDMQISEDIHIFFDNIMMYLCVQTLTM